MALLAMVEEKEIFTVKIPASNLSENNNTYNFNSLNKSYYLPTQADTIGVEMNFDILFIKATVFYTNYGYGVG